MKNTHTALFTALSSLLLTPVALAFDEGSETTLLGPAADAADPEEEEATEEEEVVDEGDYCGGGEASPLDEADQLLGDQDFRGLYREVGGILRAGRADWQRAQALSYLATAQLHMGRFRPAARNFQLAFAVDAEQVAPALRVEQAIAELRNGQRDAARQSAQLFAEQECIAPAQWLVSACWAARTVMAETTDDAVDRDTQRQLAAAFLPQDEERLGQVADYRALLGESLTPTRVAAR